jgi:hypothetical protein
MQATAFPSSYRLPDRFAATASGTSVAVKAYKLSRSQGLTLHRVGGQQYSDGGRVGQEYGVAATVPTREITKAARMAKRIALLELDGLVGEESCVADIPCAALISLSPSAYRGFPHALCLWQPHDP